MEDLHLHSVSYTTEGMLGRVVESDVVDVPLQNKVFFKDYRFRDPHAIKTVGVVLQVDHVNVIINT